MACSATLGSSSGLRPLGLPLCGWAGDTAIDTYIPPPEGPVLGRLCSPSHPIVPGLRSRIEGRMVDTHP